MKVELRTSRRKRALGRQKPVWFHRAGALAVGVAALPGCNALDEPVDTEGGVRLVPTDERPALLRESPPPALNGGTLLVTRDGSRAVAVDEVRDRLSVVNLASQAWSGELQLPAGSEPGRSVEGDTSNVYVLLRRAGTVVHVSLDTLAIVGQYPVCAAPRGIAFDGTARELLVACASGRFVNMSTDGTITRSVQLPNDLRDVVVEGGNVWVSRFRSAEVLRLDGDANVVERLSPPAVVRSRLDGDFIQHDALFEPNVGWRLAPHPLGGVTLVHQASTTEEISLDPSSTGATAYGSAGGTCNGIQRSTVTTFRAGGQVLAGPEIGLSLPVDMYVRQDGRAVVLGAGGADIGAPRSSIVSQGSFSSGPLVDFGSVAPVNVVDVSGGAACTGEPLPVELPPNGPEQYVVSVAAVPASVRVVVQMRDPAQLVIVSGRQADIVPLGGDSVADTGFDLFHRDAEAGLSCASCHPAGTDDGHVWRFEGQGPRRTQPVDVGLEGTAPFHWDGTLPDVGELMSQVFVDRMGGVYQSPARRDALEHWLFSLTAPVADTPRDPSMVFRGQHLFESYDVGCADCHRGPSLTDNNNYDVGTGAPGERFQVPSLLGVGTRSRFIHDGCANTLSERFGPDCGGGDRHGRVSQLDAAQVADLLAYLETL